MRTEKLIKLIEDMAELIEFHELAAIDSHAVKVLRDAQDVKRSNEALRGVDENYLDQIAVENAHSMVG